MTPYCLVMVLSHLKKENYAVFSAILFLLVVKCIKELVFYLEIILFNWDKKYTSWVSIKKINCFYLKSVFFLQKKFLLIALLYSKHSDWLDWGYLLVGEMVNSLVSD